MKTFHQAIYGFLAILVVFAVSVGVHSFVESSGLKQDCENLPQNHCSRDGKNGKTPCDKCSMECQVDGTKPDDPKCTRYCCRDRCDCFAPCHMEFKFEFKAEQAR